jgi:site-specific DNA-methyltransferase (adenine-specific)
MAVYYQDDYVTLYHGDCLEQTAWLDADVLITDPPYGMNRSFIGTGHYDLVKVANDHDTNIRDNALQMWGNEKGFIVFGHWKCERPTNIKHLVIWDKDKMPMGDATSAFATSHEEIYVGGNTATWLNKRQQSIIRAKVQVGADRPNHPTPKPIALMELLVSKTNTGVIADPFAGSGATLVAARNLGRKSVGIELEEKYCEIIATRLSQQAFDFGDY